MRMDFLSYKTFHLYDGIFLIFRSYQVRILINTFSQARLLFTDFLARHLMTYNVVAEKVRKVLNQQLCAEQMKRAYLA